MTDLIAQRLIDQGFTKPYEGATHYEKAVPGRFGFTVTVTVEGYDGDPLPLPEYEVHLGHQCDAWVIAKAPGPVPVLIDTRDFAQEVALAYNMLADLIGQHTHLEVR